MTSTLIAALVVGPIHGISNFNSDFFFHLSATSLQPGVDPPGLGLTHKSTRCRGDLDVHDPYRIVVAFESECIKLSSHRLYG